MYSFSPSSLGIMKPGLGYLEEPPCSPPSCCECKYVPNTYAVFSVALLLRFLKEIEKVVYEKKLWACDLVVPSSQPPAATPFPLAHTSVCPMPRIAVCMPLYRSTEWLGNSA